MFISYEVVVWILDKLWGLLINLLLLPIAILGLTLDYVRHQARRVSNVICDIKFAHLRTKNSPTRVKFFSMIFFFNFL